jgi:hypothetical protein
MNEDPKKCSMTDCNKPMGPDALEFTHGGEPAGGVCENCLDNAGKIRIVFSLAGGKYYPEEMVSLG